MNILIIPDKFKGTLTAEAAAQAIARGWNATRPDDLLDLLPMSDGGDGFGEVLSGLLGAKVPNLRTINAAHPPCAAKWRGHPKTRPASIGSGTASGLANLAPKRIHPFEPDSHGLGRA